MANGEDKGSPPERTDMEIPSTELKVRKWVGVNIKFIDGHFLVTFNHDTPRIFHNMEEMLAAIQVEAGRLTVSS